MNPTSTTPTFVYRRDAPSAAATAAGDERAGGSTTDVGSAPGRTGQPASRPSSSRTRPTEDRGGRTGDARAGGGQDRSVTDGRRRDRRARDRSEMPAGEPSTSPDSPADALEDLPPRQPTGPRESGTEPDRSPGRSAERSSGGRDRLDGVDLPADDGVQFDADVDRVVERLYRKLERKQRIERERRGL